SSWTTSGASSSSTCSTRASSPSGAASGTATTRRTCCLWRCASWSTASRASRPAPGGRRSPSWRRTTARRGAPASSTTTTAIPTTTRRRTNPMNRTSEPTRRRGERGVALLLVLWIFMVLGVIALDFARYMRDDAMASINLADETQGYYLALAGMNRAIFDAESGYYLKRRVPYRAKNAFFDSPEELLLVRGVTPALYYGRDGVPGLRDIFSVYNRATTISVDRAPAAVFQALLGIDAAAAADLIAQRDGGAPIRDLVTAQLAAIDPTLTALVDVPTAPHLV